MNLEQSGYAALGGALVGFLGMIASVFGLANLWVFMAATGMCSLWSLWVANRSEPNLTQYPPTLSQWQQEIDRSNLLAASKRSSAATNGRAIRRSQSYVVSPTFIRGRWEPGHMDSGKSRQAPTPSDGPTSGNGGTTR